MPVPGWYEDPDGSERMRWWDGSRWTDHWQSKNPAAPVGAAGSDWDAAPELSTIPRLASTEWSPPPSRTFVESIKHCFKNYATFKGRASRSEFWWWTLFTFLASFAPIGIDFIAAFTFVSDDAYFALAGALDFVNLAVTLGTIIPSLAVSVRRAHDVGHSGLILLVPVYNFIYPFRAGTRTPNRFD